MNKIDYKKKRKQRQKLIDSVVKSNINCSDNELLLWAMNQLFRAARNIDLLDSQTPDNITSISCDATASTILKRLIQTKHGYNSIKQINPTLLRGYKKPIK